MPTNDRTSIFRWFSSESIVALVIALCAVVFTHYLSEQRAEIAITNMERRLELVETKIEVLHLQHTDIALVQRDIRHIREDVGELRALVSNMLIPSGSVPSRLPDAAGVGAQ